MKKLVTLISSALIFAACTNSVESETTDTTPKTSLPGISVDASYLSNNLSRSGVIILDARANDSLYAVGHIPGALNVNIWGLDGNGEVLPPDVLSPQLAAYGITSNSEVIIYGDNSATAAAKFGQDGRLLWILRGAGIANAKILDGGIYNWTQEGNELSTTPVEPVASNFTTATFDAGLTISTEEVAGQVESGTAVLLDSRSVEEYNGAQNFGEARGGYLPGAKNLHYVELLDENSRFLSVADIEAKLTALDFSKDDQIISYCTGGIRSAFLTMVLRELGYSEAVNYDASFAAWAKDETLPLE